MHSKSTESSVETLERMTSAMLGAAPANSDVPALAAAHVAQIKELRTLYEQVLAERDKLLEQRDQLAVLLRCADPSKIQHDLRNILNELQLYKMLAESQG